MPSPLGLWQPVGDECCACSECYHNMIVICIYDESAAVYYSVRDDAVERYDAHVDKWHAMIDAFRDSTVRAGMIQPGGFTNYIKPSSRPLPHDSDRSEVDYTRLRSTYPRVKKSNIVDMFETIRTTPTTIDAPELLLFCLDNSGSIVVGQYASELEAAKAELQASYPDMEILDDRWQTTEAWVHLMTSGVAGRTCG